MMLKLKKKLPPNRTYEQILNHYLVEKSISDRLRKSNREQRQEILGSMYDELFSKVPDHSRLTRRNSEQLTAQANKEKLRLIKKFLNEDLIFVEFAPGDCRFVYEVAKYVKFAYGIDISDQRDSKENAPKNFQLIVYDGYNLNDVESNSIDILFSDQLIEHFHPEDTELHFKLVHRILKKGGKYVFRTPHRLSGPHDISAYFCDEAECFHLKEWTYSEIKALLKDLNYSDFLTRWRGSRIDVSLPYIYFGALEKILPIFPKKYIRKTAKRLIPSLYGVAIK
ncbi:class I SAM-dependent methyltransferase [Echinicola jeungdonensis]|uniref:Methyltransferase domain-containing protein n=1 Tax=Echinicola jeungdonensis TaxID=709343 RepID=A0ABV5J081_9BACT|nr:class I SAM-dependent methyltransferase [Echinicola jeungdonensis]MDN3671163.1 class I SAM-dependent methyltransferase [Echinicola jeungdonensis]